MGKIAAMAFASTLVSGLVLFASPVSASGGDTVFQACAACHTTNPSDAPKFGPPLNGVVGRPCGSVAGYEYSKGYTDACTSSSITWTEEEIHAYLDNPTKYLKSKGGGRSKMSFMLKDEAQRKAVIEFLKRI
jgi:cytochrome c